MDATDPEHRAVESDQPLYIPLLQGRVVRLLELAPGQWNDPVITRLFISELPYTPPYDAISYVWGDPQKTVPIACNGRRLDVTVSLNAAFRRVRLPDRSRIVWADAVCINQQHLDERGHQVSFMNDVYNYAREVLVCLGDDVDGGAKDVAAVITGTAEVISKYDSIRSMPILPADDLVYHDSRWKSVAAMLQLPWFTRAWVIQEVGLAKNPRILYGKAEFSYRDLIKVGNWITRCAPNLQARASLSFYAIHLDWENWGPDWRKDATYPDEDFFQLLNHSRWLGCSDHRDKIYAFLGHPLARSYPGPGLVVQPDYTKDPCEVYLDLAIQLVRRHGLRVLSATEHDDQTLWEDVPSWVPFWSPVEWVSNSLGVHQDFYYQASTISGAELIFIDDDNVLHVKGFVLDTVAEAYRFTAADWDASPDRLRSQQPNTPRPKVLEELWSIVNDTEKPSIYEGNEREHAFSLSLCAGLSTYNRAEDDIKQHRRDFAAYWRLVFPTFHADSNNGDAERYWVDMKLQIDGRSFLWTEKGYMGVGPCITQPGDLLCILFGAKVPFVLRQVDDPGRFKLVGEAYCHGIMQGEAMDMLRKGAFTEETFKIC